MTGARRRAVPTPRRSRRRRRSLVLALVATALVAAAWVPLGSGLLAVRSVRLAGVLPVSAARVRAAAAVPLGSPLLTVDTSLIARRVQRIPQIRSAVVSRAWPNAIVIWVRPRTPLLALPRPGGYVIVDQSGVRLAWSARKPPGLPVLVAAAAARPAPAAVREAGAVLAGLPSRLLRLVASVRAAAAGVTLRLSGGVTVIWGSPSREHIKAAEVAALLRTHARNLDVSDPGTAVAGGG